MNVSFYIDPLCPWCWITSRWMTDVASGRDLHVIFKPFSLAIKNDVLNKVDPENSYSGPANETHRILRVMESVRKQYGDDKVAELYAQVGRKIHIDKEKTFEWLGFLLDSLKIDQAHLEALDDESYDAVIETWMD